MTTLNSHVLKAKIVGPRDYVRAWVKRIESMDDFPLKHLEAIRLKEAIEAMPETNMTAEITREKGAVVLLVVSLGGSTFTIEEHVLWWEETTPSS